MVRLFDEGTKVLGNLAERRNGAGPYSMATEAGEATKLLGEIARQWVSEPGKLAAAQNELFKDYAELWGRSVRQFLGEEDVKPVIDQSLATIVSRTLTGRTANSSISGSRPILTARWAEDVTRKTEGLDDKTRKRALFYLEQMLAALSPSNFALTNPEVVRATLATNAANLCRGWRILPMTLNTRKTCSASARLTCPRSRWARSRGYARQDRLSERSHPADPIQPEHGRGV